jgi:hypothetical protein
MSGFAALIDTTGRADLDQVFEPFQQLVAGYKSLGAPSEICRGAGCLAAKFDTPASLHRRAAADEATGSWLLAAGTVVDTRHVAPDGDLSQLLRDYLSCGEAVFQRCDGLFALVIYNGLTRRIALVSDLFGYFSVFYGSRAGQTFIATSALAVARQIGSEPSELGVHCFLRTGKVFGELTLWRDVRRLRPATILEFGAGAPPEQVYWQPALDEGLSRLSFADAVDASMQLLQGVLRRNLAREGKVWTDLTGGFDTRFLTMLLARAGVPFKANFVGAPSHPDVQIARAIVARMGWEHQHFDPPASWPQESPPYLDDALGRGDGHLNIFLLLRSLWAHRQEREQMTTLLSGLGGEMWRGLTWWPERAALGRSTVVHYDRQLWSLMHPVPEALFATDTDAPVRAEILRQFEQIDQRHPGTPNTFKLDCLWIYRETAHVGAWASVGAGLLRIVPALFSKDIISHVISLHYRWKVKNQLVRQMLACYAPTLAAFEIEGRGPAAPPSITNFYRFIPSRLQLGRKAANKLGEIAIGRTLWPDRRAREYTSYSRAEWRRAVLAFAQERRLFHPAEMRSGRLYRSDQLAGFVEGARAEEFRHEEFLGRMMTVELAMRAVGGAL